VRRWGERSGVVLIVLGIVGLVQPLVQGFFTNGFTILLIGTIIFVIASHL
jgi:TM2 domain-containing membrane protein YozV